jgi:hypothetical protein
VPTGFQRLTGQFALIVQAYVPTQSVQDGGYKLPNVERAGQQ